MQKYNFSVSFKTTNKIKNLLNKRQTSANYEEKSGVYKINCSSCSSYYIGQTGRTFIERFSEHTPTNFTNIKNSHFAQHLVNEGHNYTNFNANLKPMHFCKKGTLMDAWEEFEIHKAVKLQPDSILNEKLKVKDNPLFDTAVNVYLQS